MPINSDFLMQALSAAGAGLNEQPWTQNLNQLVQSGFKSKHQNELISVFRQMFAGKLGDSKMSVNNKGLNMTLAPSVFENKEGGMGAPQGSSPNLLSSGLSGVQTPNVQVPGMPNLPEAKKGGFLDFLNPSPSQLGLSAADLAGLTPQDVSNALSGALNIEQLKQRKMESDVDTILKMAQVQDIIQGEPLDRQFPIQVPDVGAVTLREWQSLPMERRNYAAYVNQARTSGDSDIMSYKDFINEFEAPERAKFLEYLEENPEMLEMETGLRKSGATRISVGEKVEQKKAMADIKGQIYFKDPKWLDAVDADNIITTGDSIIKAKENAKPKAAAAYIESKIAAGGGTIVGVNFSDNKRDIIWKVKWPSGDTETIKYAIGS